MPPIYIVVLNDNADVNRVKSEIEALGFKVSRHLKYLNMLVIEGPEERVNEVAKLEGIKAIDKNRVIKPR